VHRTVLEESTRAVIAGEVHSYLEGYFLMSSENGKGVSGQNY
jgi:hypothetical protein